MSKVGLIAWFGVLGLCVNPPGAHACCNVIPSAAKTFRGTLGSTDRPFAGPGDFVQLQVQPPVCDAASPGFGTTADAHVVSIFFTPPAGPAHVVVVSTDCSRVGTCAPATPTTCIEVNHAGEPPGLVVDRDDPLRRLAVRFPDTESLLPGEGLAGPATIAVTAAGAPLACTLATRRCASVVGTAGLLACVDDLFTRDGTCRTTPDVVDPT